MADFIFRVSPNIILGSYTVTRLGQFASEYGKKYIVILDPMLKEVGSSEKVLQPLVDRKLDFFIFDNITEGATSKAVEQALSLARQAHIHGIIAIGGDKALCIGKAVAAVFHESHDFYDFMDGASPSVAPMPLICVPTTIRDPFVFSSNIPIVDSRSNRTKILKTQNGICKMVLFDPNLCVTLSENQTQAMAIESLCLAVEAYLSPKATFFSDMIAEKAVELIGYALDGVPSLTITTPQEILLSQGGCMASLASATASPGAATLLAMTINAKYRISRALITSIFFPYIIEDHAKFKGEKIAKLAKLLRAAPESATNEEAAAAFSENIRQRLAQSNLPARLKDLSVSIEQLALASEDAGELELMNFLPKSMTSDDLFDLVKTAF